MCGNVEKCGGENKSKLSIHSAQLHGTGIGDWGKKSKKIILVLAC